MRPPAAPSFQVRPVNCSAQGEGVTGKNLPFAPYDIPHKNFVRFLTLPRRTIWSLFEKSFDDWSRKNCQRMGAALAYYTIFSLAPLLVVVVAIAGFFFGAAAAQGQIVWQLRDLMGKEGGDAVQALLQSAYKPVQGIFATVIGLFTLLLGASLVVAELRGSLNTVWEVPLPAGCGFGRLVLDTIKERLFAFSLVLGIGFLLLVSLVLNALISLLGNYFQTSLPVPETVLQAFNFLLSLTVTCGVFALMFKILPDAKIAWSDVAVGALITGVLFTIGKLIISVYLANSSLGSAYGAAGSLVVLLAWFYYSAQIFLFGAVFTRVIHEFSQSAPKTEKRPIVHGTQN